MLTSERTNSDASYRWSWPFSGNKSNCKFLVHHPICFCDQFPLVTSSNVPQPLLLVGEYSCFFYQLVIARWSPSSLQALWLVPKLISPVYIYTLGHCSHCMLHWHWKVLILFFLVVTFHTYKMIWHIHDSQDGCSNDLRDSLLFIRSTF